MAARSQRSFADRTPLPLRVYRHARVSLHVFQGIATTAFVFPMIGLPRRQALIRRWSERLLRIMSIESRVHGLPPGGLPGNMLIVANHISWLDIFVLNTVQPARFIAKAELKRWPLVGLLIAGCGTLFIERERRRDAHRVNDHAREVLAAGDTIAIFPEGTTTDGTTLLPFHGSLLQPVIDAQGRPAADRHPLPASRRRLQRRARVRRRHDIHGLLLARARRTRDGRGHDADAGARRARAASTRTVARGRAGYSCGLRIERPGT